MTDILRVCGIAGYVALGLFAAWRAHAPAGARGRGSINAFLLYTLTVSFAAGLFQREMWPFSTWPLVAGIQGPSANHSRLVAVDRAGVEHNVDYRAWQPFVVEELQAWAGRELLRLGPEDRTRAAEFMVQLAEQGRQDARAGRTVGYFDRLWGPLAAPYFLLHPKWWSVPGTTPPTPLVGIRLYRESWNLEQRRTDPSAVQRSLVFEYLRP